MIKSNILKDSKIRKVVAEHGAFSVIEYTRDTSLNSPKEAIESYFATQMNIRKRQVLAKLNGNGIILQAGAMQLMAGDVKMVTNVKGTGDFMKKLVGSKVTGETAVKPHYSGNGLVLLEPTYKHILFEDLADWNGQMCIEDGLFLASDDTVNVQVKARTNLSSAIKGGEGLFNAVLTGSGIVVLESPVGHDELIYVDLEDDVLKIDGNFALAWSNTLEFTVERSTKSIVGSATSGEGFVNVYRGSGRVILAPV